MSDLLLTLFVMALWFGAATATWVADTFTIRRAEFSNWWVAVFFWWAVLPFMVYDAVGQHSAREP